MNKNIIAIVGKPNVGKSTLFNRIVGKRISIVLDQPGVTRDRIYQKCSWKEKDFILIDTGGISDNKLPLIKEIKNQVDIAIDEAKVIIFVVDGTQELTNEDFFVASLLRKTNKPIILVANKLDQNKEIDSEVYKLGFDNIYKVSALHNEGIASLLEKCFTYFDFSLNKESNDFKLSIIGKPNAGKSSLLNNLVNKNRSIVSDIAGTTRDSVLDTFNISNHQFTIIDTAGIRKKSRLNESVDHYALLRAFDSLEESNLALLVIDATKELSFFDARIAGYALEKKKPIITIVNKWDLIEKSNSTMNNFKKKVQKEFKFMSWSPILFISAKTGSRVNILKNEILKIYENIYREIPNNVLNEVLIEITQLQPPKTYKNKRAAFTYIKQIYNEPIPTFIIYCKNAQNIHFTYKRYLENQLRTYFDFSGTPINLIFKEKK